MAPLKKSLSPLQIPNMHRRFGAGLRHCSRGDRESYFGSRCPWGDCGCRGAARQNSPTPDDYRENIRGAKVDLVFNSQRNFEAKLTWAEFRHLRLMRGQENLPRVAHIAHASDLIFIAFPLRHDPPQVCNGIELQPGNILLHGQGEGVHLLTRGASRWGSISLAPDYLAACGRALAGLDLAVAAAARILQPSRFDAARLRSLHAKACHLAETKPTLLAHPEVSRAIEQDLIHALVNCLTSNEANEYSGPELHHIKIMDQYEQVLAKHSERAIENTGALRGYRRVGKDVADLLRQIPRYEPGTIYSPAASHQGARRAATCRLRNSDGGGSRQEIWILGARAVRRTLSAGIWRDAIGHACELHVSPAHHRHLPNLHRP